MDFRLGDSNVFYVNARHYGQHPFSGSRITDMALWRNYGGSKVWPAPQGWCSQDEWPGPPDSILDSGAYEAQIFLTDSAARVHLKSKHDEYSGITLERDIEVRPGSSSVQLRHTMRNTSKRPVRWSIWQVTQVDAGQGLDIFVPAEGFRQILGDSPYQKVNFDAAEKKLHLVYDYQVAKFAVRAHQGWLAVLDRSRGKVFVEIFPISREAEYPDGAPVALWISGDGTFTIHGEPTVMTDGINGCDPYIETEVMGPLTEMEPGESCELRVSWKLAAIHAEEIVSVNHCGVVGRRLARDASGITGSFGVFHEANLELVAFDRTSRIAGKFALGKVSPLRPLVLDEKISLPSDAVRVSLLLFDEQENCLGTLDHAPIR